MESITIGDYEFSYDDTGEGDAILLLSGWCQDHRLFTDLVPELAKTHRVLRFDWRGHGNFRQVKADFDIDDQADDLYRFLDAMGLDRVTPVSTSHGGWANIAVTERCGAARIGHSFVIDWIQTTPPADFFEMIDHIQDQANWEAGIDDFFSHWIGDTKIESVINHVKNEMAGYSFDMWARSGREIGAAYRKYVNPMQRMLALKGQKVTHIFSQPFDEEYHQAQKDFAAANDFYTTVKLPGKTHFPTLEQPKAVAEVILKSLETK